MKKYEAFGEIVPDNIIEEIKAEFPNQEITTDFLETLYEYEQRDNS